MIIFPIQFKIGCVELDAIVTESDGGHRFKVELVTGEADPILLRRNIEGAWTIESHGGRTIPFSAFQDIQKEIEAKMASI